MTWEVEQGDCLDVLKGLAPNSVDLICTDPPYGISFMSKNWDKALPETEVFKECLRVLKPGAFAFVMSGARADCLWRMMAKLEEAGFWVHFTPIFWAYGTGFPKAQNIAKHIEKKHRDPDSIEDVEGLGGMTSDKGYNVTRHREIYDKLTHPDAMRLQGSYGGFQPKPAVEVIICAMKPMDEKTFIAQALANGHGVTWLGNGRIPHGDPEKTTQRCHRAVDVTFSDRACRFKSENQHLASASPSGRFPANLLVSDDVLNDGRVRKSKPIKPHSTNPDVPGNFLAGTEIQYGSDIDDAGSFSRYFSLDAWFAKRLESMPESVRKTFPFLLVPKPSKTEKNKGCDYLPEVEMKRGLDTEGRTPNPLMERFKTVKRRNPHPTVKPVKLMSYLIELGSRKGDLIVDPYAGSGTTGVAAVLLERNSLCIELDPESAEICKARISKWAESIQGSLF